MTDREEPARGPEDEGGSRGALVIGGIILVLLLGYGFWSRSSGPISPERTPEQIYREDERIAPLIAPCPFGRQFDGNTSNVIPVMVAKLEEGQRQVLHRFRSEIAKLGAAAMPELKRLFDRCYPDQWRHGVLQNVLGVCALMDEPHGLELARVGLEHPQEGVRLAALDVVQKHGDASDYDRVRPFVGLSGNVSNQSEFALVLQVLDRTRFHAEFADWLETYKYIPIWSALSQQLEPVEDPEVVTRYLRAALRADSAPLDAQGIPIEPDVLEAAPVHDAEYTPGNARPFLVMYAAQRGDEEALAFLEERMQGGADVHPQMAMEAFRRIGMHMRAAPILASTRSEGLRRLAAEIIAEAPDGPEARAALTLALGDPDQLVRSTCLRALAARGDEAAIQSALFHLTKDGASIEFGIEALRDAWETDPTLPERAFQTLKSAFSGTKDVSRRLSVLKAMGRVPFPGSAEFLLAAADTFTGTISGHSPHRWCCGQSFNVGPSGRAVLRDALVGETDPMRRLDLLSFIWQDHSDEAREVLIGVVSDPNAAPLERLFAADRLTQIGPAGLVAPILKAQYVQTTDADLRPGLQCLLWIWYGLPNA